MSDPPRPACSLLHSQTAVEITDIGKSEKARPPAAAPAAVRALAALSRIQVEGTELLFPDDLIATCSTRGKSSSIWRKDIAVRQKNQALKRTLPQGDRS